MSGKWGQEHPKELSEARRKWRRAHPEAARADKARQRAMYPEHERAHQWVANAKRDGRLPSASSLKCRCGEQAREYHHEDYQHPERVIALCRDCHIKVTAGILRLGGAQTHG